MKLYNTLSRKKEEFEPLNKDKVGMYSCGPTVYWFQHIGNLRTYIFNDILKRTLTYNKFKVKHVMNVTDVGHLTSDADEGEDKMEKAAAKEGKSAEDIANFYLDVFKKDLKKLNILDPDVWCKATEHIPEQIELVQKLTDKGYTYETSDGIYFDTSKIENYGQLAKLNIEGLEEGKRTDVREKKNKTDFALWKFSDTNSKRQQEWDAFGHKGFPGWHIECSAMSSKYLGDQFDIHTGGEDHVSVHHTNEIAQSEAAFEKKPWVKYWVHGAFLTFKGEKVSKSKGGLYTVEELEEQGYEPLDYRYLCLNTHYRKQLSFSLETLDAAKNAFDNLKQKVIEIKQDQKSNKTGNNYKEQFTEAVSDDLNMPVALSVMWAVIKNKDLGNKEKYKLLLDFDQVLGLDIESMKEEKLDVPQEVQTLLDQRQEARDSKDFKKSDELRDKIKELGFEVKDSKEGQTLNKL